MAKKKPETEFVGDEGEQNQPDKSKSDKNKPKPKESVVDKILSMPDDELLPWEEIELPSKGFFYNNELMQEGVVKVRPMNINVEKVLANQRQVKSGRALDILFEKCVQLPDPDFNPLELLAGDRYFLMFYIRGITYGDEYEFSLECPHCGNTSMYDFNLSELIKTQKVASEDQIEDYPISIKLPYLSEKMGEDVIARVKFPTGKDLEYLFSEKPKRRFNRVRVGRKRLEPTSHGIVEEDNNPTTAVMKNSIVDINGEKNQLKIGKIIEKLHSKDLSTINQILNDKQPGIDTTIEVDCPNCDGRIGPVMLPITEAFFRTPIGRRTGKSVPSDS